MAWGKRDAQYQKDALSGIRDLGVHSLVCSISFELPDRHLEEMMEERGVVFVEHSSINRWAIAFCRYLKKFSASTSARLVGWRMGETYIRVKDVWKYLNRVVDKEGKIVDFLLTAKRDKAAANRFFEKAMRYNGDLEKVTMDKSEANKVASMGSIMIGMRLLRFVRSSISTR
jgi:putative transposase